MRIAQIAPLAESVPPKLYGGTERVVSWLTEGLLDLGHEVTLFASGDSVTSARLIPCCDVALRLNTQIKDPIPYHVSMLERVRQRVHEFDVLHFHIDIYQYPLLRALNVPALTTTHGRLDFVDSYNFFKDFPDSKLVSISDHQRLPMPPVDWLGTVYHGLPENLLGFSPAPADGGYLAFLGRISPEKRPDRAIEIATRLKQKLRMAAKIDKVDQEYWDEVIEPMIQGNPYVEFIGEIGESQKAEFLGNARALLFPIDWPEPFGLVMIEAMACGTPVLAFRCGSVPEVMEHGVSGWIVDTMDEALAALSGPSLDRAGVRRAFEQRFTSRRMAEDYVEIYEALLKSHAQSGGGHHRLTADQLPSMLSVDTERLAGAAQDGLSHGDDVNGAIRRVDLATEALRRLT